MADPNPQTIAALRLQRQHLVSPATHMEYDDLFRTLSPVTTVYWCRPGEPPRLVHRAAFDDLAHNDRRRAGRDILKGRYLGGAIGYVDRRDLELFACATRKALPFHTRLEEEILTLLRHEGPMTIGQMKEVTGHLVRDITPALHRLQQAFEVFEDQIDRDWDRGFYRMESEFPEVDLARYTPVEAAAELIRRWLPLAVAADATQVRDYFRLPATVVKAALALLRERGEVTEVGAGLVALPGDATLLCEPMEPAPSVFALHRADPLVRQHESTLKARFAHPQWETLFYLLLDGQFAGAVVGAFKQGPFVLEDVILTLPDGEKTRRREAIVQAIYKVNDPERSPLRRWDGKELEHD